jgi:small-conductance mechanosensitive channel
MSVQKTATHSISTSNTVALFIANLIFFAGVIFVAMGVLSFWKGDIEGLLLMVPGLFSLVLGWVFDDLLRKWCD